MKSTFTLFACLASCALWSACDSAPAPQPAPPPAPTKAPLQYSQNFDGIEVGRTPDDFLVLDGEFAVAEFAGGRVLELPGKPLSTFGVLLGPDARSGIMVTGRIWGQSQGRRKPRCGVGLGGAEGWKLRLTPAARSLQLVEGEEIRAQTPYQWQSETWTRLRLEIKTAAAGKWRVAGKAWPDGQPEPAEWTVEYLSEAEPTEGRPSIWGTPYSSHPMRFDDLRVAETK